MDEHNCIDCNEPCNCGAEFEHGDVCLKCDACYIPNLEDGDGFDDNLLPEGDTFQWVWIDGNYGKGN